jgi:TonB family protein
MLAASALVHVVVAGPLRDYLGHFLVSGAAGPKPPVRVVSLSPEQWSQNLRTAPGVRPPADVRSPRPAGAVSPDPLASPSPSPSPSPTPPAEKVAGTIVDVPPTADDTPDPNARFLSRFNSRVEKETTARLEDRDRTLPRVTPKLQREGNEAEVPRRPVAAAKQGDGLAEDRAAAEGEQRLVLKMPDILRQEGLELPRFPGDGRVLAPRRPSAPLDGNAKELEVSVGKAAADQEAVVGGRAGARTGTGDREVPTLEALMPTMGTLDRISGSPREADVDGVEEGDATFLNAKEFKYATFFLRVRDAVQDHWEDALTREYKRRDPSGSIYGMRDRNTLLAVTLRPGGELADVQVADTSGVDFLDDVAIEAFRKAQPFPNPPPGIVDEDGLIHLNFMFKVAVGGNSPFQFRGFAP